MKELVVSWVEELEGPYVFALRGLPALDSLKSKRSTRDGHVKKSSTDNPTRRTNYIVDAATDRLARQQTHPVSIRSGDLALDRVRPKRRAKPIRSATRC